MKKNLNNESHHYFLILFLLIMQIDFLQEDNAVFYAFLYALYFLEKTKHLKQIFYYLFQAFPDFLRVMENLFLSNCIGLCRVQSLKFFAVFSDFFIVWRYR